MAKNHVIKFLVTEDQFNRVKTNASIKGHKTLSAYLRDLALNRDFLHEKMLVEIYREVVTNGRTESGS